MRFLPGSAVFLICACTLPSLRRAEPDTQPAAVAAVTATPLPPVPLVEGPLDVRVVYPRADALVTSRDSNFIFGSIGNGKATLAINGVAVPVLPNGSFLAFLHNPPADAPRYELVAVNGADTVRVTHSVRISAPRVSLPDSGVLVVDSASATPPHAGVMVLSDDEPVRVSVRAPRTAAVWLQLDSATRQLAAVGESMDLWATDVPARQMRGQPRLIVARGADTVGLALTPVGSPDSLPSRWAVLRADSSAGSADTDRVINVRPTPAGTYKWFLMPGTQLEVTGRVGNFARLKLDTDLEAWALMSDVRFLAPTVVGPRRVAANARVVPSADWVDLVIPIGERPAYFVEESDRSISLTLYSTRSATDIIRYVANDSFVQVVGWEQETSSRVRYTLSLSAQPFGYLVFWDRGSLVLRVRKPPTINAVAPLKGLTIVVDPGHPPAGATGPTGLYEAVPVLDVGLRLKEMLEEKGATVVMTRSTPDTLALGERPVIARRANAHALISIHLNALPDGVNPFTNHGTGTYFFHPQAAPLARAIQNGMVARMGLRNLGIYYDNLALARPTWMPSVLCEGAFLMIPEQEAAIRTAEFQDAYARGVADGLESYFRNLRQSR